MVDLFEIIQITREMTFKNYQELNYDNYSGCNGK